MSLGPRFGISPEEQLEEMAGQSAPGFLLALTNRLNECANQLSSADSLDEIRRPINGIRVLFDALVKCPAVDSSGLKIPQPSPDWNLLREEWLQFCFELLRRMPFRVQKTDAMLEVDPVDNPQRKKPVF
jgi:hypothetical protein